MVERRDDKATAAKRRHRSPEADWIRGFLEYAGTENVSRVYPENMRDVSLVEAIDAIFAGEMIYANKCEGPGAVCVFRYDGDDRAVEVKAFFVAAEMRLEIWGAKEVSGEPDDAA